MLLEKLLSSVSSSLKAPVCISNVPIDVRSQFIRTAEVSPLNFILNLVSYHRFITSLPPGIGLQMSFVMHTMTPCA